MGGFTYLMVVSKIVLKTETFSTKFSVNFILTAMENPICSCGSESESTARKKRNLENTNAVRFTIRNLKK